MIPAIGDDQARYLDLPARFIALGCACFLISAMLMPWAVGSFDDGFYRSEFLAFVHLNTVGIVAAVLMGASYQLMPVVLQSPLIGIGLARVSFWLHLIGVLLFVGGLWQAWRPGIAIGAASLFTGLLIYVGVIGITVWSAAQRSIVAWHVTAGMFGLLGGVSLGFLLALNKGAGFLGGYTLQLIATHALLMIGGWVLIMFNGVAYQLVGMFTLAEDQMRPRLNKTTLITSIVGVWTLALGFATGIGHNIPLVGATIFLAGQVLFGAQMLLLYHYRRRRAIDVHMPFAVVAIACALLAILLLVIGIAADVSVSERYWIIASWLGIVGFAVTATQGFLYKISTFLVWLYRYAPLAGRTRVPRLEELYGDRLARAGWLLWSAGLALTVVLSLAGSTQLARLAGLSMAVGIALFLTNMARIASHWWAAPAEESVADVGLEMPGVQTKG